MLALLSLFTACEITLQVKTEANLKLLLDEQQFLSRKGKAQASTISQKEDKETKEAEKRARELQKRKKKDEEYFEKNRNKFEEEEKEFEKREKEAKKAKPEEHKDDQFSPGKFDDNMTKEALLQLANDEEEVRHSSKCHPHPIYSYRSAPAP